MAYNTSPQARAHYLHASLERYDRVAAQEIIRRFEEAAATTYSELPPHSLNYNEQEHVFLLVCQNRLGSQLDENLGHIIHDYIASPTTTVTRFAECDIADPFDDYEVDLDEDESPPLLDMLPPEVHLVSFDGINAFGKVKAFRLHELPDALRNRAVGRHEIGNLADAITFRRVRWDQPAEQHFFDASIGHELPELSSEEAADLAMLLDVLAFNDFGSEINLPQPHRPERGVRHFEFVNEEPTIDQWLEGMGETRQVDPKTEPEMTRDAQRFASGPSLQSNTGRIRKPLGMTLAELREPEMTVQTEKTQTQINNTFAALLKSGADGDSDTESSESTADDASILDNIKPASIAELVERKPIARPSQSREHSGERSATDSKTDGALALQRTQGEEASGALAVFSKTLLPEEDFPTYEKSYANVDGVGLCGDAVNQVNWEKENATRLSTYPNNYGSQTYEALLSSRAESVSKSMSAGKDLHRKQITSVTPMTYRETPLGGDEPWADNIVAPIITVPMGNLIDTDGSLQADGRPKAPKFPPGLFPPLGSSENQQSSKTDTPSIRVAAQSKDSHLTLIEEQMRPSPKHEEELLMQFEDDETPVIERVQPQHDSDPRLFRTMDQKAPKPKNQKKKPKASNIKAAPPRAAQLELPSPPPPPKPQKATDSATLQKQKHTQSDTRDVNANESAPLYRLQPTIDSLLMSSFLGLRRPDVVVQFGLILMTGAEHLAANKALRCDELQDQLDELSAERCSTSFVGTLGRKSKDGVFLLRLPVTLPGSGSPYAESSQLVKAWTDSEEYAIDDRRLYEITIVVPGGHKWNLIFDQDRPQDAKITQADTDQQDVFVHYPLRVWDARIRPVSAGTGGQELGSSLKRSIKTFLKTLNTPEEECGETRPIFEAIIPDATFQVTNVLAKRALTQNLRAGTWIVTQVWDLHLSFKREGVVAFAKPEDIMEDEGRLWWEAALQHGGGEELAATMNEIVERLDSVGWPAIVKKLKQEKSSKSKVETYIPFW